MFLRKLIIISLLGISLLFVPPVYSKTCDSHTEGIKVYIRWDNEAWEFTWHANNIQKREASYAGAYAKERTNVRKGLGDERSESLPQNLALSDKRFDTPFDISHNGELLIATIYNKFIVLLPSKNFAVVDIKRKHIIRTLETDYYVASLTWSPDGNYFAVLFSEDVTKQTLKRFGPLNLFADFLGHPISYYTFYLAIYDSMGTLLCTECIIETIPLGEGYLEWNK